jgi:hypothetical protein
MVGRLHRGSGGRSPAAIEAGMAEYVRQVDSEFFPKPGKLRELAQKVPNRMARAVQAIT